MDASGGGETDPNAHEHVEPWIGMMNFRATAVGAPWKLLTGSPVPSGSGCSADSAFSDLNPIPQRLAACDSARDAFDVTTEIELSNMFENFM